jgi:hypothetical protein
MHYLPEAALFLLLISGLVLLSWWCAGPRLSTLESTLLPLAAMLGGVALAMQLLGMTLGVKMAQFAWLGLLLPLLWTVPRRAEHATAFRHRLGGALRWWRGASLVERLLLGYLFVPCAMTFVLCLAPPNAADYDSLVYHLAAPRQYLLAGRIGELPYDHHTYFPFTLEMLYLAAMMLRPDLLAGAVLAKLFHWLMLPLSCGALIALGQRHATLRVGLLAAALFASLPVVLGESFTAYIDVGYTAFTLLAFFTFWTWKENGERSWLLWSAVFCGFCLGTKYLGALTFGWLGLWLLQSSRQRKQPILQPALTFAGVSLLIGGWWYLRNWMWTGNPVFPFAYEIFGGRGWTAEMARAYAADQARFGFSRSPLDLVWLPWRMSMSPFYLGVLDGELRARPFWPLSHVILEDPAHSGVFEVNGLFLQAMIGPALLAFGLPFFFLKNKPRAATFCAWSFGFFFVFWAVTGQYLRYLLPAFALLCLPCAWAAARLWQRGAVTKWASTVALATWFVFVPAWIWRNNAGIWSVAGGAVTPQSYVSRSFTGWDAMQWASANTPRDARFVVWGEPRCYYLDRAYFWADDPHNNLIDYAKVLSAADLSRELRRLGATHVLWNSNWQNNNGFGEPPPQWQAFVDAGYVQLLSSFKGYNVYQINDSKLASGAGT